MIAIGIYRSKLAVACNLMVTLAAVVVLFKNTRTYDDRREAVTVFFETIECRRRNFSVLGLADPIDMPICGSVGNVKGLWNVGGY